MAESGILITITVRYNKAQNMQVYDMHDVVLSFDCPLVHYGI